MATLPYAHPLLYDLEYDHLQRDIEHYVELVRRRGGPVLELGIGNGRVAIPMARAGVEVHGVDASTDMLASLQDKLASEPPEVAGRVRAVHGDFRRLNGPPRYRTVLLPFNAVHHCETHTDLLELLGSVDRVMMDGGRFFLDCYLPDPVLHNRDPKETYAHTDFTHPLTGQTIHSWESSWYDPLRQIHHVVYTYVPAGEAPIEVKLALRVFHPQEFRALLEWGGFVIEHEASSFDGHPVRADSSKWVLGLRRR